MMIDLRSDGVTKPTDAMYDAMRRAPVGHAAWGEDPTVNELEKRAAEAVGHEAALFTPTGTMANQIALRVHTAGSLSPEVLCEARCHLIEHEAAGAAVNAGVQVKPLAGVRGMVSVDALAAAIEPDNILRPQTSLLWLENTHNFAGGTVLPLDHHHEVQRLARSNSLPIHLDGARIFNAATAQGVDAAKIGATVDTLMFCFSKSLGAPVGSALCGSHDFIARARRVRHQLGGAMYQSGVVAAAALVALEESPKRLHHDHAHAKILHAHLRDAGLDTAQPETNILILDTTSLGTDAAAYCHEARLRGVLVAPISRHEVRAVTHQGVTRENTERAAEILADTARALRKK